MKNTMPKVTKNNILFLDFFILDIIEFTARQR